MKVSAAYEKEYRDWIHNGQFERVYGASAQSLPEALKKEHPALVAINLDAMATCFYIRGTVTLLNNDPAGWRDIHAGYWAALYGLSFDHKAATLPAWSQGRSFRFRKVESVMTSGFARLFQQDTDASRLQSIIGPDFDAETALGDKVSSGQKILQSILDPRTSFSFDELLKDRKACCQKRDAWPKRPTEFSPFGVIDIEAMLRYPQESSFQYPESMGFDPTNDDLLVEGVTAYHSWYE